MRLPFPHTRLPILCLALAGSLAGCASMEPTEFPRPASEIDARPGMFSGARGEFLLFGCAPAEDAAAVDALGAAARRDVPDSSDCHH